MGGPLDSSAPDGSRSPKSPHQGRESQRNLTEWPWKGRFTLNVGRLVLDFITTYWRGGVGRFSKTKNMIFLKFSPKIEKNNLRSHTKFEKNSSLGFWVMAINVTPKTQKVHFSAFFGLWTALARLNWDKLTCFWYQKIAIINSFQLTPKNLKSKNIFYFL